MYNNNVILINYLTETADQSQVQPNLSVYDVSGKKLLKSFFQQSQVNW